MAAIPPHRAGWSLCRVWRTLVTAALFCLLAPAQVAWSDNISVDFFIDGDLLASTYKRSDRPQADVLPKAWARMSSSGSKINEHADMEIIYELMFQGAFPGGTDSLEDQIRWEAETDQGSGENLHPGGDENHSWDILHTWEVDYKFNSSGVLSGLDKLSARVTWIHEFGPHVVDDDDFRPSAKEFKSTRARRFDSGADEKIITVAKGFSTQHPATGAPVHRDYISMRALFVMLKNPIQADLIPSLQTTVPIAIGSAFGGPNNAEGELDLEGGFDNVSFSINHKQLRGRERFRDQSRVSTLKLNAEYAAFDMGGSTAINIHSVSVASAEDFHGESVALGTATELLAVGDAFENPASAIFIEGGPAASVGGVSTSTFETPVPLGVGENHFVLYKQRADLDGFEFAFSIESLELEAVGTGYEGAGHVSVGLISDYSFAFPSPFFFGFMGQHLDPTGEGVAAFVTLTDDGTGFGGTAVIELTGVVEDVEIGVPALQPFAAAVLATAIAAVGLVGLGFRRRR